MQPHPTQTYLEMDAWRTQARTHTHTHTDEESVRKIPCCTEMQKLANVAHCMDESMRNGAQISRLYDFLS